jgi:hypothetical protein
MSVITIDIYEAGGMGSIKLATATMNSASTSVTSMTLANGVSSIPLGKNITIHSRSGSSANGSKNDQTFRTRAITGGNGTTTLTTAHANPH